MMSMFIHTITIFVKMKAGFDEIFEPRVISPAFYTKENKVSDNEGTLNVSSVGKAVIPFNTSLEYCPPAEYTALPLDERENCFTLSEGSLVVFGDCSAWGTIRSADLKALPDFFTIRSIANYDLPGMQVRAVSGL